LEGVATENEVRHSSVCHRLALTALLTAISNCRISRYVAPSGESIHNTMLVLMKTPVLHYHQHRH